MFPYYRGLNPILLWGRSLLSFQYNGPPNPILTIKALTLLGFWGLGWLRVWGSPTLLLIIRYIVEGSTAWVLNCAEVLRLKEGRRTQGPNDYYRVLEYHMSMLF